MSTDAEYILFYDDYKLLEKDKIKIESDYGGDAVIVSDFLYYDKPKHLMYEEYFKELNAIQILQKIGGEDEWCFVYDNTYLFSKDRLTDRNRLKNEIVDMIVNCNVSLDKMINDFIENEIEKRLLRKERIEANAKKVRESQDLSDN